MGVIVKLQHKMNIKILSLAILALFVSLSFASALSFSPSSTTISLVQGSNRSVTLTNDGSFNLNSVSFSTPLTSGATMTVLPASTGTLAVGQSTSVSVLVSSVTGSFKLGDTVSAVLNATGTNGTTTVNTSLPITLQKSFCRSGSVGNNLSITSVDIKRSGSTSSSSSSSSDSTTWKLLDSVRVKVRVENIGEETVRGVNIVLGLYDSNGANRAGDLKYTSSDEDKTSYGSLKSGKDTTYTFEFQVPADFKADTYKLALKAYSSNQGEDNLCTDSSSDLDHTIYQTVSAETEGTKSKYIAFDQTVFSPTEAQCGDSVTLSTTAYNIGEDDQDRVKLTATNDELKLSQIQEVLSGLNMGESTPVNFNFVVPQSATAKTYLINLYADYDYKDGIYRQRSSNYATYQYKVVGCGAAPSTSTSTSTSTSGAALITASLASSVAAGKPLTITTSVTNRQNVGATYALDVSGYNSWATLSSMSDRALYLDAGQTKDVTLQFNVNSDASGQNTLTVKARSGSVVDSKDVVVNVPAAGFSLGGSNMIWVIAGVNVLLLVIIIVVAVRLANR